MIWKPDGIIVTRWGAMLLSAMMKEGTKLGSIAVPGCHRNDAGAGPQGDGTQLGTGSDTTDTLSPGFSATAQEEAEAILDEAQRETIPRTDLEIIVQL